MELLLSYVKPKRIAMTFLCELGSDAYGLLHSKHSLLKAQSTGGLLVMDALKDKQERREAQIREASTRSATAAARHKRGRQAVRRLRHSLALSDYTEHVEARALISQLSIATPSMPCGTSTDTQSPPPVIQLDSDDFEPDFDDLFFWAVIAGEHELATILWKKCKEPLRCALVAARACRNIAAALTGKESLLLLKHSEKYEQRAVDLLDAFADAEVASDRLTTVAAVALPECVVHRGEDWLWRWQWRVPLGQLTQCVAWDEYRTWCAVIALAH